jgi:hypothetical protein
MIRTQVHLADEQARDMKLRAMQENTRGAEVIRALLDQGCRSACNPDPQRGVIGVQN